MSAIAPMKNSKSKKMSCWVLLLHFEELKVNHEWVNGLMQNLKFQRGPPSIKTSGVS